MRLIAADALAAELYRHHVHDDEELEPLIYLADAEKVIANAQTVDAIPVEWMEALIRSYTGDVSDIGKSARNGTIKDLIRKWQKEQEAR